MDWITICRWIKYVGQWLFTRWKWNISVVDGTVLHWVVMMDCSKSIYFMFWLNFWGLFLFWCVCVSLENVCFASKIWYTYLGATFFSLYAFLWACTLGWHLCWPSDLDPVTQDDTDLFSKQILVHLMSVGAGFVILLEVDFRREPWNLNFLDFSQIYMQQ